MTILMTPDAPSSHESSSMDAPVKDVSSPAVGAEVLPEPAAADGLRYGLTRSIWPGSSAPQWRYALRRRMLACADVAAAFSASLSILAIGKGDAAQLVWSLAFLPVWILAAKVLALYDRDERALRHLTVDEIPLLVLWSLIGTSGLALFLELAPANRLSSSSAVIAGITAVAAVFLLRASARWTWRATTLPERVAIIGTAGAADVLRRKLELFPDLHMTIVAVHDSVNIDEIVRDAVTFAAVDRICFAPATLDDGQLRAVFELTRVSGLKLSLIPPSPAAFGNAARLNHLAELPVFEYKTGLARSTLLLKRSLDVVISALTLVVLLPFFAIIALAIKLTGRGPVLFKQLRAGQHGRPFRVLKFRTMVRDAEQLLAGLVPFDLLSEPMFKLPNDPRVTRLGRFLRRWSLDELPQFINVLWGEMSLVGPRPEEVGLVERYTPDARVRLDVKPGLTGPMQVYGRGHLTLTERLAVERDYVENLSIERDLRIIG
ncbi:MAG: exopolysaccharide biosynthesis polyprenyl glycosylphosphotransferase, partial [Actinobacteria bacterium]|nr:exopolysaccharide biosynthesis polyprenyl glycosylphosphotransferase [Actinomycetota bacterium]